MWNYRVLKEETDYNGRKLERFKVIEVYYDDLGVITGWVDCTHDILDVTHEIGDNAYEDLKGNAEHVLDAFKLPYIMKDESGHMIEVGEKRYIITDNIDEATHWIAREYENNHLSDVTIGKAYELIYNENEQEHHIVDDQNVQSLIYLTHKGDYVYFK